MKDVASNGIQKVKQKWPTFAGTGKDGFPKYKSKVRACLSLHSKTVFDMFQKRPNRPLLLILGTPPDLTSSSELRKRQTKISEIIFSSPHSADNVVKNFEGKRSVNGTGIGQTAWKALTEKISHTEGARRSCDKKLVKTRMEPGQDPDNSFFVLDECRQFLEDTRQTVRDEWFKNIILQLRPPDYETYRLTSYEKWGFGTDYIQHMVHAMYVDSLLRPFDSKPIAGRGIAMQEAGHNGNDV